MKGSLSYEANDARARDLQLQLEEQYPDLTVSHNDRQIYVTGAFQVVYEAKVLTRFQIRIEWSDTDTEAPILWEVGGRVPWVNDRHIETNGKACLLVPEEWLLRPREQRSVIHYLNGPVRDFFIAQTLVEQGEPWPWGRDHGVDGLLQAYGEMVGMAEELGIRRCLMYLSHEVVKGHWVCPFCGGSKVRNCHMGRILGLRGRIPKHIAALALARLDNPKMR